MISPMPYLCLIHESKIMKKQISLFLIAYLLMFQYTHAQTENNIMLSVGPSFFMGDFAMPGISNQYAGSAKIGETINLSFEHKFNQYIGLVAMLYGQRNSLNTGRLADKFAETGIDFGFSGASANFYPNWVVDKKAWYLESFFLGVAEEFPCTTSGKFSITAKALIGIAQIQSPTLSASGHSDTSFAVIYQNGITAFALSYLVSGGARYRWSKKIYFLVDISYLGAKQFGTKNISAFMAATNGGLVVPMVYSLSNSRLPPQARSETASYTQTIRSINGYFGIGLIL
jgi:hypothetical protein